jgi:hypothetical protein
VLKRGQFSRVQSLSRERHIKHIVDPEIERHVLQQESICTEIPATLKTGQAVKESGFPEGCEYPAINALLEDAGDFVASMALSKAGPLEDAPKAKAHSRLARAQSTYDLAVKGVFARA